MGPLSARRAVKLNIILSQSIRFYRLCSKESSFIHHLAVLIRTLISERGYPRRRVESILRNAASRFVPCWTLLTANAFVCAIFRRVDMIERICRH